VYTGVAIVGDFYFSLHLSVVLRLARASFTRLSSSVSSVIVTVIVIGSNTVSFCDSCYSSTFFGSHKSTALPLTVLSLLAPVYRVPL
jgi:hypothetical protein